MSESAEFDSPLMAFVRQSNAIESITRPPTKPEMEAHRTLLALGVLTTADVEEFVRVVAGAPLRDRPGMNVRVGSYIAPPGGPGIRHRLDNLLVTVNASGYSPWTAHVEYEALHPFMDGNGRSGRAIWLWMMRGIQNLPPLHFLQAFYYQTLTNARPGPHGEPRT